MKKHFILFLLCICISVCFISLLQKEKKVKEYNSLENVELAIYLNDEETNSIPSKDSGYYYDREKSTCSNGAYINWDSVSWSPVVNNMSEYKTRCEIHFTTTYTEGILNGADPVLKDELVPITIENNGTVKKADLESEWYSYANKNWANAVILEDQYDSLNTQGSVHGATKQDGFVSFDGVDDYINLGLENYDFSNQITLEAKFQILSTTNDGNIVLGNIEETGVSIDYNINNGNELRVAYYFEGDTTYTRAFLPEDFEYGKTYVLSTTYDGSNIKLYVDGELVSNVSVEGNKKIKISKQPFYIGVRKFTDGDFMHYSNINMYQAVIYNRALEEDEIKQTASNEIKIVNEEGLLRYVDFTNKSYENDEIIPEEAIESYFVWIPKYRYQLWDLGQYDSLTEIDTSKVHEISIIFGDYNTSDSVDGECTTPMESGATGNCTVGDYMTHPAFLSISSTGFWVGKFEVGYNGATSTAEAQQNVNDSSKIIVKPNTYSWRGIQVANAFYTSYDYQRNLDSHMMKNTEWGAVAYLQHSAYGSATSVRLNNNSDYITGYAANNEPTCGYTGTNEECNRYCNDGSCNTAYSNSVLASTTGNISGIYDMSGGAWEYVMGVLVGEEGKPMSGRNSLYNSGFNGTFGCPTCDNDTSGLTELTEGYDFLDSKYYDTYAYATVDEQFQRRILGDATGEMGSFGERQNLSVSRYTNSWYDDLSYFIHTYSPWFVRGGDTVHGRASGLFSFYREVGSSISYSFRLILTPTGGAS